MSDFSGCRHVIEKVKRRRDRPSLDVGDGGTARCREDFIPPVGHGVNKLDYKGVIDLTPLHWEGQCRCVC